ncbi:MAG: DNA internalization-related competence protein ComEC/Rec2 [Candidatus Hydrogenedentes bacterium]|nr:DNA internalization-related competence protein ComEC/Rec2 [Candidatus Hydrogenedentota bacterium]
MNRPLAWAAIALLCGTVAAAWGFLPNPLFSLGIAALGCTIAIFASRVPRIRPVALVLCFIGAGGAWWGLRTGEFHGDGVSTLLQAHQEANFEFSGTVRSTRLMLPGSDFHGFVLDVDSYRDGEKLSPVDGLVYVNWYQAPRAVFPGERVTVDGDARLALSEVNPGIRGYEDFLRNRGIQSVLETSGPGAVVQQGPAPWYRATYYTARLRHAQARRLTEAMPPSILPFIYAVWLGQQSALDRDEYRAYVGSGTAHILSVSGVHAALIFLTLNFALRVLHVPRRRRSIACMLGVITFALVAGASIPAMRAAAMVCLYLSADLLDREPDAPTALSIAGIAFILWNPHVIFDVGFQLSFTCIASILVFAPLFMTGLARIHRWLRPSIATSLAVQILPAPIVAASFHVFAFTGMLANLVVIPLLAVVLWLCFATSLLSFVWMPLARIAGYAVVLPVTLIRGVAALASSLDFLTLALVTPTGAAFTLYWLAAGFLSLLYFVRKERRKTVIRAACAAFVLSMIAWNFRFHEPEVVFMDVGHGDAAFVRTTSGQTMLIDGGNASDKYDYGERVVAPFLWARGITRLDVVIASHSDRDHMGGLLYIVDAIDIGTLILSEDDDERPLETQLLAQCSARGVPVLRVKRGETITIGETAIDVLHPPRDLPEQTEPNDRSLVLRVLFGPHAFLFTGDIEKAAERQLDPDTLRSTVLKVPHHGADTSSTIAFINAVQPDYAVISTGPRGRQVMDAEIVDRYEAHKIPVLRTDRVGAIRFSLRGGTLHVEGERINRHFPIDY